MAALLIAALGQGECFADVVLTSVNLSGTVTVGPDAYRSAQTVTGSAGTGLQGGYDGIYGRVVNDATGDSGWIFDWMNVPGEIPWGPAGSSQLGVALSSVYQEEVSGSVVVQEELYGSLAIDLGHIAGGFSYTGLLSFPEAAPDRSNVTKATYAKVSLLGETDSAFDADASITFGLQSDVPLLRVFMTDDNDALVYDSGYLGGVMTSPIISQTLTYNSIVGSGIDDFYVYTITAVPEPSTLILGACGLVYAAWGTWRKRKRSRCVKFAATSLGVAATLAIAMSVSGECFAGMALTSVDLSGTVTLGPDAYRDTQTLTANAGTGLHGIYQGLYDRGVSDLGDSGWTFFWNGPDEEQPYGPGGSTRLSLGLESNYSSVLSGQPVVQDENDGGVDITLNNVWEMGGGFPGELSFPEALADKSNVRKVAHLDFLFGGATGKSQDLSMLASFVIQSDEPLLRVFVAGATGGNLNVITYDSGPLAGLTSSPLVSQGHAFAPYIQTGDGTGRGYGVYAITAVPEPSTYAMALAGLACGGFSMRRRKRYPFLRRSRSEPTHDGQRTRGATSHRKISATGIAKG